MTLSPARIGRDYFASYWLSSINGLPIRAIVGKEDGLAIALAKTILVLNVKVKMWLGRIAAVATAPYLLTGTNLVADGVCPSPTAWFPVG